MTFRGNTIFGWFLISSMMGPMLGTASATVVQMDTVIEFSGAFPPAGATPWLRATFDDGGGMGSVSLTLQALNLVASEFVDEWHFNLNPALDPTALTITPGAKVGSFDDPTISKGVDSFMADGDGLYDVLFDFASSGMGGGALRFGAGESGIYTITGIPTLTANDFAFLSAPAGGHGPFLTAAHVQGIGPNASGSGWVATPEPSTFLLIVLGLLTFGVARRRIVR